jgi:hypothetical protein
MSLQRINTICALWRDDIILYSTEIFGKSILYRRQ